MSSYTVEQTTVNQLPQTLQNKQNVGDYSTNDNVDNKLKTNVINYTTNRILEIPQDIKAELNNGVITIKAGTKVYIPNGFETDGITRKFDIIILTKDLTYTEPTSTALTLPLFVSSNGNGLFRRGNNNSGKTVPDNYTGAFYNLTTNKMESYNGGSLSVTMSLPICVCTNSAKTGNNIVSIDQIFNGFGYIGSTAFALPGVKYKFADGRNEDGTYKSITKTFDKVSLTSYSYQIKDPDRQPLSINDQGILIRTAKYFIQNNQPVSTDSVWYKPETNETFRSNGSGVYGKSREIIIANDISTNSAFNITSFEPSITQSINTYTRSDISGMAMPSGKYIQLTLGSNGTRYLAPANGWFTGNFICSKEGSWIVFEVRSKHTKSISKANGNNVEICVLLPVLKGDVMILGIDSTATYTTTQIQPGFFFVYANGED